MQERGEKRGRQREGEKGKKGKGKGRGATNWGREESGRDTRPPN